MSERSLESKLKIEWLNQYLVAARLLLAVILIVGSYLVLLGFLLAPNPPGEFLISTYCILASWICFSLYWMVRRVKMEIDVNRKKATAVLWLLGVSAISFQIFVFYLLSTYYLQLVLVLFIIWLEIWCYLGIVSIAPMPSNRLSFWTGVFLVISIGGILFTLSPAADTLTLLEIQISGAFIGLFAAISIGEVFKAMNDYRLDTDLRSLILDELVSIEQALSLSNNQMVPTPIWSAAVSAGHILNLKAKFRERATQAHAEIYYYNQTPSEVNRDRALTAIRNAMPDASNNEQV